MIRFFDFKNRVCNAHPTSAWTFEDKSRFEQAKYTAKSGNTWIEYFCGVWRHNGVVMPEAQVPRPVVYELKAKWFSADSEAYVQVVFSDEDFGAVNQKRYQYEQSQWQQLWKGEVDSKYFWTFWVEAITESAEVEDSIYRLRFNKERAAIAAKIWRQSIEREGRKRHEDPLIQALLNIESEHDDKSSGYQLDRFEYLLSQFLVYENGSSSDYRPDGFISKALELSCLSSDLFSVPIKSNVSVSQSGTILYNILDKKGEINPKDFTGWDGL